MRCCHVNFLCLNNFFLDDRFLSKSMEKSSGLLAKNLFMYLYLVTLKFLAQNETKIEVQPLRSAITMVKHGVSTRLNATPTFVM